MRRALLALTGLLAALGLAVTAAPAHAAVNYWVAKNLHYPSSCMAQPNGATTGSGVILWDCSHGQTADSWFQWYTQASGEGNWEFIINRQSGLCLYNPDNGGQLTMQACSVNYGGTLWQFGDDGNHDWAIYCDCASTSYYVASNNGDVNQNGNPQIGWALHWLSYQLWDTYGV